MLTALQSGTLCFELDRSRVTSSIEYCILMFVLPLLFTALAMFRFTEQGKLREENHTQTGSARRVSDMSICVWWAID